MCAQLAGLRNALKLYKLNVGHYPEDLEDLWVRPEGESRWRGPYLLSFPPRDPWGSPYGYRRTEPALFSWGADGAPGGLEDWILRCGDEDVWPANWTAEVDTDLRVIRNAIQAWEITHPGARVESLTQLPAYARRVDPWGTPYVYSPEGAAGGASGGFVLLSLGADRAWGGTGLCAERGWNARGGAFTAEASPRPAPASPVAAGVLSASFALLPGGALLLLLWVRRRRANAPPPPEVVLASLGGRCAYCHDDAFGVAAPCPDCGALLHGSCWLEAAECPSLGCRGRPRTSFALLPRTATIELNARSPLAAALPVVPFGLPRTA